MRTSRCCNLSFDLSFRISSYVLTTSFTICFRRCGCNTNCFFTTSSFGTSTGFDGSSFINDAPRETKWLDHGKDHYATATWNNAPNHRVIALSWMSNWEYGIHVPTMQYRSAMTVPRTLSLFLQGGDYYVSNSPVEELSKIRQHKKDFGVQARIFSI